MLVYQRVGVVFIINNDKDYNPSLWMIPFCDDPPKDSTGEMVFFSIPWDFFVGKKWKTENQS